MEKSKFHSTRVYWFSCSQCKIMHLKWFCRAVHLYTPSPFSPTLLLGTESVKGFSSSNCSHSRGSWGEQCHVWYREMRTELFTWSNSRMLSLSPPSFSVTGLLYDILLVLKLKKKGKRKSDLPVEGIDVASSILWRESLWKRIMWGRSYLDEAFTIYVEVVSNFSLPRKDPPAFQLIGSAPCLVVLSSPLVGRSPAVGCGAEGESFPTQSSLLVFAPSSALLGCAAHCLALSVGNPVSPGQWEGCGPATVLLS